jgi:hypothetical protein
MITTPTTPKTAPPVPTTHAAICGHGHARPTHGEIAQCAYDIYIEHGRAEGRSQQDWLQAEEELAQTTAASKHQFGTHNKF